jgi:diacylglycerol O-acyltransferase
VTTPAGAASRPLRFDRRMTAPEALMWTVERDPILRSSFLTLTVLEGEPDVARFRRRMAAAVQTLPRLHQRVRGGSPPQVNWPEWVDDTSFDLDYHLRHIALPQPGTVEQLLELCAVEAQDNFDVARPLWTLWLVDGLEGGRSALLSKMHHVITDGVGGMRLSTQFIDIAPDAPESQAAAPPAPEPPPGRGLVQGLAKGAVGAGATVARAAVSSVVHPMGTLETAQAVLRQAIVTESAHSPLWSGKRGLGRHFEVFSFDLDEAKAAAHALGGTVNDLYVTGIAGGAARYHRARGAEVDELRMAMPINTRNDRSAGGNSFTPSRTLVPAGIVDPAERFAAVRQRALSLRSNRALNFTDALAGLLNGIPTPLLVRMARQQVETVDFATSNVRGAPFDLYVAGARILATHAFGPTGGTAFNATVLSYKGSMDVGVNIDTAAVDDPALLRESLVDGIGEVLKAGAARS